MKSICPNFTPGMHGEHPAIMVNFATEHGNGILRSTKEYSLVYVPATGEWLGDVVAHGQWLDLEAEEIAQLRSDYNLDGFAEVYLAFFN